MHPAPSDSASARRSAPMPSRRLASEAAGRPAPAPAHRRGPGPIEPVRVFGFAALALGGSTLLSAPFALGLVPEEALGLVVPLAQLTPLLAVLVVRRRDQRLRDALGLAVPDRRRLLIGLAAAVIAFALVPMVRILLGSAAWASLWSPSDSLLAVALAVPVVAVTQSLFALGEETAWRGWLHENLAPWGFWPSALATSALWALWHLPIVLALGFSVREGVAYLLAIIAVGPLLAALREAGTCVWPAVLGHGLLNSLRVALEQNLAVALVDRPAPAWLLLELLGCALWLGAAVLLRRLVR